MRMRQQILVSIQEKKQKKNTQGRPSPKKEKNKFLQTRNSL